MRVSKTIVGFVFLIAGIFTSISAQADCGDCFCNYEEPETKIVTSDYLYDYDTSYWIRVSTHVDHVPCSQASQVVLDLRSSGFNVSYYGDWNCPRKITYGVFHDSFYVRNFNYHNHWSHHHRSFHHGGVMVGFHYNVYHNERHHYHGYATHYVTKTYYKSRVKTKYRKWRKHHYNTVPVYHKNKRKVTYKKRTYKGKKRGHNSILPRSSSRVGKSSHGKRGSYKGNSGRYKKGKKHGQVRSKSKKSSRGNMRSNKGHRGSGKSYRGSNKGSRNSKKGKYASNRNNRRSGKSAKHSSKRRTARN